MKNISNKLTLNEKKFRIIFEFITKLDPNASEFRINYEKIFNDGDLSMIK